MVNGISNSRLEDIYIANAVASIVSVFGCFFIILIYCVFRELRRVPFNLIVILAVFDLLNAVSFIIPTYDSKLSDSACVLQGTLMNFSTFAGVIWTAFIAISLYAIVVKAYVEIGKFIKWYLVIDIVGAGILTAIPSIFEPGRKTVGYCWLYRGGGKEQYLFRFITFLVPFWAVVLFNFVVYGMIFRNLRAGIGGDDALVRKKLALKIGIYPLIVVACFLPYSIKGVLEIQEDWNRFKYEYNFTMAAGIIRCLIGMFNAMIYGFTNNVRKLLKDRIVNKKDQKISCQLIK